VHPDHRGQGIAQRLIRVALKEAILKGMSAATLEVRAKQPGCSKTCIGNLAFELSVTARAITGITMRMPLS